MKYCGIDLHSNNSVVIVSDDEDRIVLQKRLANRPGRLPDRSTGEASRPVPSAASPRHNNAGRQDAFPDARGLR
jgi:hypothetical protein